MYCIKRNRIIEPQTDPSALAIASRPTIGQGLLVPCSMCSFDRFILDKRLNTKKIPTAWVILLIADLYLYLDDIISLFFFGLRSHPKSYSFNIYFMWEINYTWEKWITVRQTSYPMWPLLLRFVFPMFFIKIDLLAFSEFGSSSRL